MGGTALVYSALHEGDSVRHSSDDHGYLLKTGISYFFTEIVGFGVQWLKISAKGDMGGESIQTGSSQMQMVFLRPF